MTELKKQILVVDDDPEMTKLLQLILEHNGFVIRRAHGTAQGMQQLANYVPDLVLIDYMMPHLTGLELCGYIRRDPRLMNTPVIVYSAMNTPEAIETARKAGATRFVEKTSRNDVLIGVIKELLAAAQGGAAA